MAEDTLPALPETNYGLAFYDEGGMHEASGQGYTADQLRAYAAQAVAEERERWVTALDEEMVSSHIGVFNDGDDPRAAMAKLLAWHQEVALHPAVSEQARALIERGRAEERERCASMAECYDLGTPEGHAIAAAIRAGSTAQPAVPAPAIDWQSAVFTLIGHAEALRMDGQRDMPAWLLSLAQQIAATHIDAHWERRVAELAAKSNEEPAAAPQPPSAPPPSAGEETKA